MTAMATVAAPVTAPGDERIILHDVSWATYESLLEDHVDRNAPRFAYDRGVLEIMSPGSEHERDSATLVLVVELVAAARSIEIVNVGSMTYKRAVVQRGFEPDSSFYIQHAMQVRDRVPIDPAIDPPPDLVIEIDVTNPSLDKLPLYAKLLVPEIWRCVEGRVSILTLADDRYVSADRSVALPLLTDDHITRWLTASRSRPRHEWIMALMEWAKSQAPANGTTA